MRSLSQITVALIVVINLPLEAQQLWGSGYMSGAGAMQNCAYQNQGSARMQQGGQQGSGQRGSVQRSERQSNVSRLRTELTNKQKQREQIERHVDRLRQKLERSFESSILEFLIDTHIESALTCDKYKTSHQAACANPQASSSVDCAALIDVPTELQNKWTTKDSTGKGNYCVGNSRQNAGQVSPQICNDETLKPQGAGAYRSGSDRDCAKNIADYRKKRIELAKIADEEERIQDRIEDSEYEVTSSSDDPQMQRGGRFGTEADCVECARESRGYQAQTDRGRDWTYTITNVLGGIGMMYMGKKAEESANEYAAQMGYPSNQSYGYPYMAAGMYGIINGLTGPGAYGCSSSVNTGMSGMMMGNMNMNAGMNMNMYGNMNSSGAFGYPQSYYTNPYSMYPQSYYGSYPTNMQSSYNPYIMGNLNYSAQYSNPYSMYNTGTMQYSNPYSMYGSQYSYPYNMMQTYSGSYAGPFSQYGTNYGSPFAQVYGSYSAYPYAQTYSNYGLYSQYQMYNQVGLYNNYQYNTNLNTTWPTTNYDTTYRGR